MKKAIVVMFACAAVALILRFAGVLAEASLIPIVLLGVAMILMLLNVVAESDRKF